MEIVPKTTLHSYIESNFHLTLIDEQQGNSRQISPPPHHLCSNTSHMDNYILSTSIQYKDGDELCNQYFDPL